MHLCGVGFLVPANVLTFLFVQHYIFVYHNVCIRVLHHSQRRQDGGTRQWSIRYFCLLKLVFYSFGLVSVWR